MKPTLPRVTKLAAPPLALFLALYLPPVLALSFALSSALAALPAQASDAPRISVPTVVVGSLAAGSALEFDAVLQPVHQATITAQVGGNVLALRVKAGDAVKRGQPLVRLDDREVRANTARSDAASSVTSFPPRTSGITAGSLPLAILRAVELSVEAAAMAERSGDSAGSRRAMKDARRLDSPRAADRLQVWSRHFGG